jgi:hypothetical protein
MRQVYQLSSKRSNLSGGGYSLENKKEVIAPNGKMQWHVLCSFLREVLLFDQEIRQVGPTRRDAPAAGHAGAAQCRQLRFLNWEENE